MDIACREALAVFTHSMMPMAMKVHLAWARASMNYCDQTRRITIRQDIKII